MQNLFSGERLKILIGFSLSSLIFILILGSQGCGKDLVVNNKTLEGIWTVVHATRNDKPTTTLTNGYFTFSSNSQISTNILGVSKPITYTLRKNNISFENSANAQLKVVDLNDSTMMLESKIKGKDFHFELIKVDSLPKPD